MLFYFFTQVSCTSYIVRMKPGIDTLAIKPPLNNQILSTFNIGAFKGFCGEFTQDYVETLKNHWAIDEIELDSKVKLQSTKSKWKKHESFPKKNADGITIYVIDTGVKINHPEFEGRAKSGYKCPSCTNWHPNSHGTKVSGIIASKSHGILKNATIICVKAFQNKSGKSSEIIAAIQWTIKDIIKNNRQRSNIVNMSFAVKYSSILDNVAYEAYKLGMNMVVAAGNLNKDACDYSLNSVHGIVSVGAITKKNQKSKFSNWGKCVDLYALGNLKTISPSKKYSHVEGTSFAAPLVSSALAIQLSKFPNTRPYHSLNRISRKKRSKLLLKIAKK